MPGTGRWTSDDASLEARLPGPLRQFLELYGASRFWDSHEALEEAWRRSGSDFYQGLILHASAWVHWERRNAHGVWAQLNKTLARPFYDLSCGAVNLSS